MFKSDGTSTTKTRDEPPNFRVFNTDDAGIVNYGDTTFTPEKNTQPSDIIIYPLNSIMNSLFIYGPSIEHMITETYKTYGDHFIVDICADTLHDITKTYLFSSEESDPIKREKQKWKKGWQAGTSTLKRTTSKHSLVDWDTFKQVPEYRSISIFTQTILNPNLAMNDLQVAFPDAEEKLDSLTNLLENKQIKIISENISFIANRFEIKNEKKLKKRAKTNINKYAQEIAQQREQKKSLSPDALKDIEERYPSLDELKAGLRSATHRYLAEEYAVLLLLPFLSNPAYIKNMLKLPFTFETNTAKAVVSYPLSDSKDAEIIFATYKMVEMVYHLHSSSLKLPSIPQKLIFIDSIVPERFRPRLSSPPISSDNDSDTSSHHSEQEKEQPLAPEKLSEQISIPKNTSTDRLYTDAASSTLYTTSAPNPALKNYIKEITERTFQLMQEHANFGEISATQKIQDLSCTIEIIKEATEYQKKISNNNQLKQLGSRIEEVIHRAYGKKDGTENFTYVYKEYVYAFIATHTSSYPACAASPTKN